MRYQVQVYGHQVMDLAMVQVAVRAIEQEGDEIGPPAFKKTLTIDDMQGTTPEDWLKEVLIGIVEYL